MNKFAPVMLALGLLWPTQVRAEECDYPMHIATAMDLYIQVAPDKVLIKGVKKEALQDVYLRWKEVVATSLINKVAPPYSIVVFEHVDEPKTFTTFINPSACVYYQYETYYWNSNAIIQDDYVVIYGSERDYLD